MPKKTKSQAKTNWLIKEYSRKGYSANKIQKLLQKRHLGIRRATIQEKVRRYKHLKKKKPTTKPKPKPRPSREKRNLKFLYDVRYRIAYISRKAGHNRHGAITAKILSRTKLSTEEIYYALLSRVSNLDDWVAYVSPSHHDVIYSYSSIVKTDKPDGFYNVKLERLTTW